MNDMTDNEQDDYLWDAEGAATHDVAALERELRPLAWTPRELAIPIDAAAIPIRGESPPREPTPAANDSRGWAPLIAGLAAAAAVFAVLMWLRGPDEQPASEPDTSTQPSVQPTGRPTSPDLKDPFANGTPESPAEPAPSLKDPFSKADGEPRPRRRVSPDLKDPFANSASSQPAPPAPTGKRTPSPDLVDPFGGDDGKRRSKPAKPGKLHDPFTGNQADPPKQPSPDLQDPFAR
jgi:hypothetical protein